MSLHKNVLISYVGQAYVAALGIVMLPVYVRYLGAEAYGRVGFFTMLQSWLLLFDLGLTPTVSREISRHRAQAVSRTEVGAIIRSLEWLFALMGLVTIAAIGLGAPWIARDWLKVEHLVPSDVVTCIAAMGGIVGLKWLTGLYRGGLAGLELLVTLNVANIAVTTLRSIGVLAVLRWTNTGPVGFFGYQLAVGVVELLLTGFLFYRSFPMGEIGWPPRLKSLWGIAGLAGGMAFLAVHWVVIGQTDKLILSGVLELREYGFFAVVATLAGGISLLAVPINQALQPRFSLIVAQGETAPVIALYRTSTQMACAAVMAVAGMLAAFPEQIVRAWTGNQEAGQYAARVLPLYALGNAVVVILGLAFVVQFALGRIRWHVIGNCLFFVFWLPAVYVAAHRWGGVGTGWVWLIANLAFLLLWLPRVHQRLLPMLGWRWLVLDVGLCGAVPLGGAAILFGVGLPLSGRWVTLGFVAILTVLLALAGAWAGRGSRTVLSRFFRPARSS